MPAAPPEATPPPKASRNSPFGLYLETRLLFESEAKTLPVAGSTASEPGATAPEARASAGVLKREAAPGRRAGGRRAADLEFAAFAVGDAEAPGEEEFAVGAELVDAEVVAVGDVEVAVGGAGGVGVHGGAEGMLTRPAPWP